MKKINLLTGLGLWMAALGVQAQSTILSVGFEDGDSKYTTDKAYTPGGLFGDWVNRQEADAWNEKSTDNPHSGTYCMTMNNTNEYAGNTWDRGIKFGLNLKDNTAYRVSFWVKAPETWENADSEEANTYLKSSLGIGHEYCDMPISTKSGVQYYNNYTNGIFNDDWKHISYVTYFTNKADQDALSMNYTGKEDANGNIVVPQGDPFPNYYFLIINAYNGTQYSLDDIKVEEGVTFNEATFLENAIKLDFGYPTNIADLAKANGGTYTLNPSCVKLTINGTETAVPFVEGKEDGYLYLFLDGEVSIPTDAEVRVSFTPAADCAIVYTSDKRPSSDTESEMKVLGFTDEVAYPADDITAVPSYMSAPVLVNTIPENNSFELDKADVAKVAFVYNKEVSIQYASAKYSRNGLDYDLKDITLSEDKRTVYVGFSNVKDGEYTVTLSNIESSYGFSDESNPSQSVTFSVGVDDDTRVSQDIFVTDFDNQMTGGVPQGWNTYNEAGYHYYGFNDEARTSQFNYNWGGQPGGGGTRLYEGFSGDFNKAMYWGTRGTTEGYATYGELVKDYVQADGSLSDDCPEGLALKLDPDKYQISFLMAAWKGEPTFTFTLEDLAGNVYAKFVDIKAAPNANGATGKITGSVKCVTDFTVDEPGYYVLRFTSCEAQWQEFLLANVKLITMPSKAAYYKQLLKAAAEKGDAALVAAEDEAYNGDTKTTLINAINRAKNEKFHSPTVVEALIDSIETLIYALEDRVENIDNYTVSVTLAQGELADLDAKYRNTAICQEAEAFVNKYSAIDPATLSDKELATVSTKLVNFKETIANITGIIDALTWGASQTAQAAALFNVDATAVSALSSNDRNVIDATNAEIAIALVKKIINKEDLTDLQTRVFDTSVVSEEDVEGNPEYDEAGHPTLFKAINLSCFINNAHLYRQYNVDGVPGWTINKCDVENEESTLNIGYSGTVSESIPVVDSQIEIYGNSNYDFSQTINRLPAGNYKVCFQTRTPNKQANGVHSSDVILYNAQDADGTWDKYIYAVAGGETKVAPFTGADGLTPTYIEDVKVTDGTLTLGAHEFYVSGAARTWEPASDSETDATDSWLGTTYVDYVNIYFMSPLEGVDYTKALQDIETAIEDIASDNNATVNAIYTVSGAKVNALQKGINLVKLSNGTVKKVLVK